MYFFFSFFCQKNIKNDDESEIGKIIYKKRFIKHCVISLALRLFFSIVKETFARVFVFLFSYFPLNIFVCHLKRAKLCKKLCQIFLRKTYNKTPENKKIYTTICCKINIILIQFLQNSFQIFFTNKMKMKRADYVKICSYTQTYIYIYTLSHTYIQS